MLPRPWPEALLGLSIGATVVIVLLVVTLFGDDEVVQDEGPPAQAAPIASRGPAPTPIADVTPVQSAPDATPTTQSQPVAEPTVIATPRPKCEGDEGGSPPIGGAAPVVFPRNTAVNVNSTPSSTSLGIAVQVYGAEIAQNVSIINFSRGNWARNNFHYVTQGEVG